MIDQLVQIAAEKQPSYQPRDSVSAELHHKILAMFVSPACCGKTSLIRHIAALHNDFKPTAVFTTREARADDTPEEFRIMPHNEASLRHILTQIEAGQLVHYIVHPSGRLYGMEPSDFLAKYNLLATLSTVVETYRRLSFERTMVIGVVTDPSTWEKWFNERFPIGNPNREVRLKEAVISLQWLLARPNSSILWAVNQEGSLKSLAKTVTTAIVYDKTNTTGVVIAQAMLKKAKEMMHSER